MGIRVRKVDDSFGIWDSFNCEFVNPEYLGIKKERIKEYIKENPFPKSDMYSEKEMINDIVQSSGSLLISGTEEQADWVADMIQALL